MEENSNIVKECSICKQIYDLYDHGPMILCKQQHVCCEMCAKQILKEQTAKCPECRLGLTNEGVTKFRLYMDWLRDVDENKAKIKRLEEKVSLISQYCLAVRELMLFLNPEDESVYQSIKERAQELFVQGKSHTAIILLQNLIERWPDQDQYPFFGLGSKEEQKGFSQRKPLSWFKKQYEVSKLAAEDLLNQFLLDTPSYKGASEWYQRIVEKNPTNCKLIYGKAMMHHNAGSLKNAAQNYLKVIEINPKFSKSYCMMAFIAKERQDKRQLIRYINQCLERQPNSIFAKYLVASAKRKDLRLQSLKRVLQQQPNYARVLTQIGHLFFSRKEYDKAIEHYVSSYSINQHYFEPSYSIGYAYYLSDNRKMGIKYLQGILNKQIAIQYKSRVLSVLGNVHESLQEFETSINYYKESLHLNHQDVYSLLGLARSYYCLKKYDFSLKIYKAALSKNHGNSQILLGIMKCYKQLGDNDSFLKMLKKQRQIQPNNPEIMILQGNIHFQRSNWKHAIEQYQNALKTGKSVQFEKIYPRIVSCYEKLGDEESAIIYLKQFGEVPQLQKIWQKYICKKNEKYRSKSSS